MSKQLREETLSAYGQELGLFAVWLKAQMGICDAEEIRDLTILHSELENLESKLNLPGMLKVVSEEAFAGNANADVLGLSEGLTQIDKRAFADMTELKQVHLPESIMQIAENAFEGSEAVVIICPKDSAAQAYAEEMNIPYVYP